MVSFVRNQLIFIFNNEYWNISNQKFKNVLNNMINPSTLDLNKLLRRLNYLIEYKQIIT